MNDDMMFDYFLEMGAMRPEEEQMRKRQKMIDALRGNAMQADPGQMIGKHYVGQGIGGALGRLGQAYMASKGQGELDTAMSGFNTRQRQALEEMRRRRRGMGGMDANYQSYNDPFGFDQ